ncbi:hypothetical protein FQN54_001649 [Arachnomyces sp. PD_36]|nr:hypothetical protein FQN54_001649 [Arachnomyces sp. PD_36]
MDLPTDESTGADTIELLESRLRRIEFLLSGNSSWTGEPSSSVPDPGLGRNSREGGRDDEEEEQEGGADRWEDKQQQRPVATRLAKLEHDLKVLSAEMPAVRQVLQLYTNYPELFQTPTSPHTLPATLTTQNLSSIVLSHAAAFPETASRLASLKDLPIPKAAESKALIELQPRLEEAAITQDRLGEEVSELRVRSARVLQRWYEVGLVGGGECWAEWEGRVEGVERGVRREEVARERREE